MRFRQQLALICSAHIRDYALIKEKLTAYPNIIAVDGGADHCKEMGITPDLIIGDLDSIEQATLTFFKETPLKKFPEEKDSTDLELALAEIDWSEIEQVTVFAALENRADHALTNLIILSRYPGKVVFETEEDCCFAIDQSVQLQTSPGQRISLIPLNGDAVGVTTSGLKWELENQTLGKNYISISNEANGTRVDISLAKGDLLCFLAKYSYSREGSL